MATVANLIFDALAELGVVGANDEVPPEDQAFCFRRLNQILSSWSNSRLIQPELAEVAFALNGAASYTIGPSGDVVAARPLRVDGAIATDANGVDYPVRVYTREDWDSIAVKNVDGGPPEGVWYESSLTNGRAWVYPRSSGYTLKLDVMAPMAAFSSVSDEVTLPEGYYMALALTLADSVASAYGATTPTDTRRRLAGLMASIRALNAEPMHLCVWGDGEDFRIERGY